MNNPAASRTFHSVVQTPLLSRSRTFLSPRNKTSCTSGPSPHHKPVAFCSFYSIGHLVVDVQVPCVGEGPASSGRFLVSFGPQVPALGRLAHPREGTPCPRAAALLPSSLSCFQLHVTGLSLHQCHSPMSMQMSDHRGKGDNCGCAVLAVTAALSLPRRVSWL